MRARGARHNAREFALRMIYSDEINSRLEDSYTETMTWRNWADDDSLRIPKEEMQFARDLKNGVSGQIEEIDDFIEKNAKNWKMYRIAPIEKSILRLAIYEISCNKDMDTRIILNEAVELAKCYGDENSSKFVNGILDSIAREIRFTSKNGQFTLFES